MIASNKAHHLVVELRRPAFQWEADEVLQALEDCREKQDVVGASAVFGALNEEHKCFFGFDFRNRTTASEIPESEVQEAIVLNCTRAAQYYELIRAQQTQADA
jgi:hypothetical protein